MKDLQILVVPMHSKQDINADSNYVVYTELIKAMRVVRPDWHFVVIFPDAKSGFSYADDNFFKLPNVTRVPQRISPRKMASSISYDGNWHDALFRQYAFDIVWANLVEVAGHLAFAGQNSFAASGRPVVVAAHHYVIHESLSTPMETMLNVAFAQVMGASLADHNVFNSEWCRKMFFETASKWLNEEAKESIKKKGSVMPLGPLDSSFAPVFHDHDVPIIAYNHRLQGYKSPKETFQVLQELWDEGLRFRLRYMNNTMENVSQIAHYPFVEVKLCPTRTDYLRELQGCDLNVSNSKYETFGISAVESMAFGQPIVAPNGSTFPEITGAHAGLDYPYLFGNIEQQKIILRRLLQDKEERKRWGLKLSEYTRKEYGSKLWAQRYASLFEKLNDFPLNSSEDARAFVAEQLERHSGCTVQDFYKAVAHQRVGDRVPYSNQSLAFPKLIRIVRKLGGRVVMEKGVQKIYAE